MADIFSGADEVAVYEKLPPLAPGEYTLAVESTEAGETPMEKVPYFRARFNVVEANGEGANAPNTRAEVFIQQNRKFPKYAIQDIKAFGSALIGKAPTDVTEGILRKLGSNPAEVRGARVKASVRAKTLEDGSIKRFDDGNPICQFAWSPVPTS